MLEKKLEKMAKVVDLDYYINCYNDKEKIKQYYRSCYKMYNIFQSRTGCVHFVIKYDDKKSNIYEQLDLISKYIDNRTKKVLEIGCGQGSNIKYMAKKNKGINFLGVDLVGRKLETKNCKIVKGDYHDLSNLSDFDLVFAIETLCYSLKKEKVFEEVNKVLKEGGYFIIFDGYEAKSLEELDDVEKRALRLVASGMAVERIENIKDNEIERLGFKLVETGDYSLNLLKNLKKFEKMSDLFFNYKLINKIGLNFLSDEQIGNIITGNLGYELFKNNYYVYKMLVYQKVN